VKLYVLWLSMCYIRIVIYYLNYDIKKAKIMRVKNINGTSQHTCKCGSWIQHWRNYSGQIATECRAAGCSRKDLVGAHVQKDVSYDSSWYIVPFCNMHNQSKQKVELVANTVLVSANVATTCGR